MNRVTRDEKIKKEKGYQKLKRKILKYCVCISIILCLYGCKKQDNITNEIELSKKNYIEKFSGLELPEQGNIILYENELDEEYYGGEVYVGLELNLSEKKNMLEQIKHFVDIEIEEDEERFGFKKKEIKKAGTWMIGTVSRFEPSVPIPFTSHLIAFLGERDGKLYLYLRYDET